MRSCSRLWKLKRMKWKRRLEEKKKSCFQVEWRAMRSVRFLFLFHLLRTIYINSGSNENDQKRNLEYKTYQRRRWQANLFIHFENPFSIRTALSFFPFFFFLSAYGITRGGEMVFLAFIWARFFRSLSPSNSTLPFRIKNIKIYTFITHVQVVVRVHAAIPEPSKLLIPKMQQRRLVHIMSIRHWWTVAGNIIGRVQITMFFINEKKGSSAAPH